MNNPVSRQGTVSSERIKEGRVDYPQYAPDKTLWLIEILVDSFPDYEVGAIPEAMANLFHREIDQQDSDLEVLQNSGRGRENAWSIPTRSVIERAKGTYADELKSDLESQHMNRFVAIEPESGDYFLGDTFDEAAARTRYPSPSVAHHQDRTSCRLPHGRAGEVKGLRR